MKKTAVTLLMLLLLITGGCAAKKPIVPDFTGQDVQKVYDWCGELSEKYSCEVSYANGNGVEKDKVIEQSVKGGSRLESEVSFIISNGETNEIPVIHVDENTERSDVEAWAANFGLLNVTYINEANDTIKNNHIIRIEPLSGIHVDTPVTVYVSNGPKEPVNTDIVVNYGDYIGLTVEEFERKATELGLKPNHQTSRDRYDANVKIGNISWHGSGTYVKDEVFNYGVCINEIYISAGAFVGKSEEEFISSAKTLNLTPKHITGRDAYSTSIDQGYIVTHGYGTYEEKEDFKYGLSLGPAKVQGGYEGASEDAFLNYLASFGLTGDRSTRKSDTVAEGRIISYNTGKYSSGDCVSYVVSAGQDLSVNVPDMSGRDESELLAFLSNNGLNPGVRSQQSSMVPNGAIISNDTGIKFKGSSVNYVVSSGPYMPTAYLDSLYDISSSLADLDRGYEATKSNLEIYLNSKGFTNYTINRVFSTAYYGGSIVSFTVDGSDLGDGGEYVTYAEIIINVSDDRLY